MGIVSSNMLARSWGVLALRNELIPLSDRARLIDLVKFKGTVEESRRSGKVSFSPVARMQQLVDLICCAIRLLTSSQLVNLDLVASLRCI